MDKIRRICTICAKFSKFLEIMMYPFLIIFIISYGFSPLIENDNTFFRSISGFSLYGKLINYISIHVGVKVIYWLLLLIIIASIVMQIILMNILYSIFKKISYEGKVFVLDNVKPVRNATLLTIVIIIINIANVLGLFFGLCLWTNYLIFKYQSEIQNE